MKRVFVLALMFLLLALLAFVILFQPFSPSAGWRFTPVAPLCAPFYERYGGVAFFGPPLGEAVRTSDGDHQVFANAELFCTPTEVHLAPLGAVLMLPDPDPPSQPDPLFAEWINQHGGLALFGPPLTAVRRNEAQRRWEQHFRNLGVALYDGETQPVLLPYGQLAWEKGQTSNAIPANPSLPGAFPEPLVDLFRQIGGVEILGTPLTSLYLNRETGDAELIFTYAVAGITRQSGYTVARLLPVVQRYSLAHIDPALAQPTTPDPDPRLRFWQTDPQQGKGYNFLEPFYNFLQQHGGVPVLCGQPISERQWGADGHIEQWCTQVGLWLKDNGAVGLRPVGQWYLDQVYPRVSAFPPLPQGVTLNVQVPNDLKVGQTLLIRVTVQGISPSGLSLVLLPPGNTVPQLATPDAQGNAEFSLLVNDPGLVGSQILHLCLLPDGQGLLGCQSVSILVLP